MQKELEKAQKEEQERLLEEEKERLKPNIAKFFQKSSSVVKPAAAPQIEMASEDLDYQKNLDQILKEYTFITTALKR